MKKCIVRDEKEFKVVLLNDDDNYPANYVIRPQKFNTGSSSFQLSENDVKIEWTNGTYQGHWVYFSFKGVKIKSINAPEAQSVCDYLNKISCMEQEEIDNLYETAQLELKPELEQEILNLKNQRDILLDEVSKLSKIKEKKDELFKLIGELNKDAPSNE
jgi:hypothetical protein